MCIYGTCLCVILRFLVPLLLHKSRHQQNVHCCIAGVRVGMSAAGAEQLSLLHQFDQVLLDKASWAAVKPDVVLQLGSHMVSKRTLQFLEWSAVNDEDL